MRGMYYFTSLTLFCTLAAVVSSLPQNAISTMSAIDLDNPVSNTTLDNRLADLNGYLFARCTGIKDNSNDACCNALGYISPTNPDLYVVIYPGLIV